MRFPCVWEIPLAKIKKADGQKLKVFAKHQKKRNHHKNRQHGVL